MFFYIGPLIYPGPPKFNPHQPLPNQPGNFLFVKQEENVLFFLS